MHRKLTTALSHSGPNASQVRQASNARYEHRSVGRSQSMLSGPCTRSTKFELNVRYQGRLGVLGRCYVDVEIHQAIAWDLYCMATAVKWVWLLITTITEDAVFHSRAAHMS